MPDETLTMEAFKCRRLAREFVNRPEQPFLLKMADVFAELARPKSEELSANLD